MDKAPDCSSGIRGFDSRSVLYQEEFSERLPGTGRGLENRSLVSDEVWVRIPPPPLIFAVINSDLYYLGNCLKY